MSPARTLALAVALAAFPFAASAADKVPPLADLIKTLKDGDRAEQHAAAKTIHDHYSGKCLEAIPQLAASQGREMVRPYDIHKGLGVDRMIAEAARTAGPERFKLLFELTADNDPFVRAGAFDLLYTGSEQYQKWMYATKEKSDLDLEQLLKAVKRARKDDSPLVRGQAMTALRAFAIADRELRDAAVDLLAEALEDTEEIKSTHHLSPASRAAGSLTAFMSDTKLALPALLKAVRKESLWYSDTCCEVLGRLAKVDGEAAKSAVTVFREQLADPKKAERIRRSIARAIREMGKAAEPLILDLMGILAEEGVPLQCMTDVYETLQALGPTAAVATATLVGRLGKERHEREPYWILLTLSEIGPAAERAVKPLEEWAKTVPENDKQLQQAVTRTLSRIK